MYIHIHTYIYMYTCTYTQTHIVATAEQHQSNAGATPEPAPAAAAAATAAIKRQVYKGHHRSTSAVAPPRTTAATRQRHSGGTKASPWKPSARGKTLHPRSSRNNYVFFTVLKHFHVPKKSVWHFQIVLIRFLTPPPPICSRHAPLRRLGPFLLLGTGRTFTPQQPDFPQ